MVINDTSGVSRGPTTPHPHTGPSLNFTHFPPSHTSSSLYFTPAPSPLVSLSISCSYLYFTHSLPQKLVPLYISQISPSHTGSSFYFKHSLPLSLFYQPLPSHPYSSLVSHTLSLTNLLLYFTISLPLTFAPISFHKLSPINTYSSLYFTHSLPLTILLSLIRNFTHSLPLAPAPLSISQIPSHTYSSLHFTHSLHLKLPHLSNSHTLSLLQLFLSLFHRLPPPHTY
jgi:hypothetical protein